MGRVGRRLTTIGAMSIEMLPSGKYRAVVRLAGEKAASKAVGTLAEAKMLEARLTIEMGSAPIVSDHTFGELVAGYLTDVRSRLSPTTMDQHDRSLAALPSAFLNRSLQGVTAQVLDSLYAQLMREGHSEHRTQKVHKLLSVSLRRAVRYGWISSNPCRDVDNKPNPSSPEIDPPTPEQVRTLIAAAESRNQDLAVYLRLAANTGVRRGEGVALRWSDATMERLTVRRSLVEVAGVITERPTKTGSKGHRVIGLDAKTGTELQRLRVRQSEAAREALLPSPVYIFSHDAGVTPWRPHYVTLAFSRMAEELGMPDVRLHDLRHFMATQMLALGIDVTTVSKRLGHATTATTLRTYAHFVPERDRDAAESLGALI